MPTSGHSMKHYDHQERVCADCGSPFRYTAAEQRFRDEQGMVEPSRCPECRAERRAKRNNDLLVASSGGRGGANQDRRQRRQGRGPGDGPSGERYPAICADCGASTMVPFIPRGDRPVYCRSCFNARKGR